MNIFRPDSPLVEPFVSFLAQVASSNNELLLETMMGFSRFSSSRLENLTLSFAPYLELQSPGWNWVGHWAP